MLTRAAKATSAGAAPLAAAEDQALRHAFGRFAIENNRPDGAAVVRRYQHREAGNWILCDCLDPLAPGANPPALVPVSESHIRRHVDHRWPDHADDCDFFREPQKQRRITATYRQPAPADRLDLIKGYGASDPEPRPQLQGTSYARDRPPLARLLARLMTDAGLQRIGPDWRRGPAGPQYNVLKTTAGSFHVMPKAPLKSYLCTYAPDFERFRAWIGKAYDSKFHPARPHGILLIMATAISQGKIIPSHGPELAVRGRISLFGEREGHARVQATEARRPPYLVACLVGRPEPNALVQVLKAYAHPVKSPSHLLLVDSDYERQTLDELIGLRWQARKHGVRLTIDKPLFDIGPEDAPADPFAPSRPPLIPDFIVTAERECQPPQTIIVETMGYADPCYRERKVSIHAAMSAAFGGAPVVKHDFGNPDAEDHAERTRLMKRWIGKALRMAL